MLKEVYTRCLRASNLVNNYISVLDSLIMRRHASTVDKCAHAYTSNAQSLFVTHFMRDFLVYIRPAVESSRAYS